MKREVIMMYKLLAVSMLAITALARAQCTHMVFEPPSPVLPGGANKSGVEMCDPDGPEGPAAPYMIYTAYGLLNGSMYSILNINGPYGWTSSITLPGHASLMSIKQGAAGQPIGSVLVFGSYSNIPGNQYGRELSVARYDGTNFHELGDSDVLYGRIMSLVEWDEDGDGPQAPVLLASGSFRVIGGEYIPYLATYDGQRWRAFGSSFPRPCELEVHDLDGPGPERPSLFLVERQTDTSSTTGVYMLDEDGLWASLNIAAGAMTVHDEDGPGPMQPALFHARVTSYPIPLDIKKRVGDSWVDWPVECARDPQGQCLEVKAKRLASFDPDADGPRLPELAIGGEFSAFYLYGSFAVIRDGRAWIPPRSPGGESFELGILQPMDPDGPGPRAAGLLMAGGFSPGIMIWDGDFVMYTDQFLAWSIYYMFRFDADGPGPEPLRIFGTGYIERAERELSSNMVVWEDGRWRGLSGATQNVERFTSTAVCIHDFDGPGPGLPRIISGGDGSRSATYSWNHGARVWERLGNSSWSDFRTVSGLVSFDEDGAGPLPATLFMCGTVTQSQKCIRRFDNGLWVDTEAGPDLYECYSMAPHDPDGAGNGLAMLLVAEPRGLLRWTGLDWVRYTNITHINNSSTFHDMLSVDLDGIGPRPTELVLGVKEFSIGTTRYQGVHAYDGASWRRIGGALPTTITAVRRLFMFDHDGPDGPAPEQLSITCYPSGVYRLENNQWIELQTGTNTSFRCALTHLPGADGPGPGELFLTGTYTPANSASSRSFAQYKILDNAQVTQQPIGARVFSGQNVSLSVDATGEELRYQWRRGTTIIQNGPGGASVGGGTVSGAQGPVLTITGINCSDAGSFSCTVSNGCSSSNSAAAAVTLRDCCTPDYNNDGSADTSDIFDLAHDVASGTATYPPNPPDFNNDGAADTSDILDLANVIAGGDCP